MRSTLDEMLDAGWFPPMDTATDDTKAAFMARQNATTRGWDDAIDDAKLGLTMPCAPPGERFPQSYMRAYEFARGYGKPEVVA